MAEESNTIFKPLTSESFSRRDYNPETGVVSPDPTLSDGEILSPEMSKQLNAELIGIPLEEIDPFYQNEEQHTFIALSGNGMIYRFSASDALHFLSPLSIVRRLNICLITNWIFTTFMIGIVLLNVGIMCVHSVSEIEESIFIVAYIFEFFVKICARGVFMNPHSALRFCWNWVDVFIILTFPAVLLKVKFSGIITAMRILKLIPLVYDMRLYGGMEFLVLFPLTIFVFSVSFLQMYMGTLTRKCLKKPAGGFSNTGEDWKHYIEDQSNWYKDGFDFQLCGNTTDTAQCPEEYTCINDIGPNPARGLTSFDNIFLSYLSTTRIVTQDFWENLYQQILATTGPAGMISFIGVFVFISLPFAAFAYALVGRAFINSKRESSIKITEEGESGEQGLPWSVNLICWKGNLARCSCESICPSWEILSRGKPFLPYLEILVTIVIVFDIIIISIILDDRAFALSYALYRFLTISHEAVFLIYAFEFISKLLILSPKTYFKSFWNIYDFVLMLAWIQVMLYPSFTLLLMVMMRVFKLVPRLTTVQRVFTIIKLSLSTFCSMIVIFFIFMILFSLIGMDIHSEDYLKFLDKDFMKSESDLWLPRWNFNDMTHSYFHVFRMLCGEWIETLWDTVYVSGHPALAFTGFTVIIGNYILLHISVAIVITTVQYLTHEESQPPLESTLFDKIFEKLALPFVWIRSAICPGTGDSNAHAHCHLHEEDHSGGDLEILHNKNSTRAERTDENILGWKSYFQFSSSPHFHTVSILAVILGIFAMCFTRAESVQKTDLQAMFWTDIIFVIYFVVELILRLVSAGFVKTVRNLGWIFDLAMVLDMVVALCLSNGTALTHPRGIIYLQCFRPYMLFSRVTGLRVVAKGIFTEILLVRKYIFALLFIWLGFGIPALQMFGGSFNRCVIPSDPNNPDSGGKIPDYRIIKNSMDCERANYTWINTDKFHFDNMGNTFLSLFSVSSLSGWLQIQADAADARWVGNQPHREVNLGSFHFFILFIIFGVFFPLNIMFGVLIHLFNKPKFFGIFMTETQRGLYLKKDQSPPKLSPDSSIPRPTSKCGRGWYDVVTNTKFETIVVAVIVVDIIKTSMDYNNISENLGFGLWTVSMIVNMLYLFEFIVKIIAFRLEYFKHWINLLDFIVVVDAIIAGFVPEFGFHVFLTFQIFRPFRIVRIFRYRPIMERLTKIQKFLRGFWLARSSLRNLFSFILVLILTYALVGHALFSHISIKEFDQMVNFQTMRGSLLITFQLFVCSGWDGIYASFRADTNHPEIIPIALIFLISSLLTTFTVLANMYIVLTLEVFNQLKSPTDLEINEAREPEASSLQEGQNQTASTQSPNDVVLEATSQNEQESTEDIPL